jgi:hypothetical protein
VDVKSQGPASYCAQSLKNNIASATASLAGGVFGMECVEEDTAYLPEKSELSTEGKILVNRILSENDTDVPADAVYTTVKTLRESTNTLEKAVNSDDSGISPKIGDPLNAMQIVYDEIFPGHSLMTTMYDTKIVHDSELKLNFKSLKAAINLASISPLKPLATYMPSLRTVMSPNRPQSTKETLIALVKRNFDVPSLATSNDFEVVFSRTWGRFLRTFCHPKALQMIAQYRTKPVKLNRDNVVRWVERLTPEAIRKVDSEHFSVYLKDVRKYNLMNKSQVKPKCDISATSEYSALQTVVYYDKEVNAVFGPVFLEMRERFISLLRPNVLLNMKKNRKQIEEFLQQHESFGEALNYVENDFAKFDKSQQWAALRLEWRVYEMLGLDVVMQDIWEYGHVACTMTSFAAGIKVWSLLQRHSGDPATAPGNTIVNIVTVAACYEIPSYEYAMVLGDDSVIATRAPIRELKAVERMAGVFNLSAKLTQSPYGFFCSAFIVKSANKVLYMSDPVKRTEKLGGYICHRSDDKIKEMFVSLGDLLDNYKWVNFHEPLADAVRYRYKTNAGVEVMIQGLYTVSTDYKAFRSLYSEQPVSIIQ